MPESAYVEHPLKVFINMSLYVPTTFQHKLVHLIILLSQENDIK